MELRYCSRLNRAENFGKGGSFALVPCTGEACERWCGDPARYCIHLVRCEKERRLP